jgi:hypothetical protein
LRDRVHLGPAHPDEAPSELVVPARRYQCQVESCRAVILVVPRGVLAGRRYSASAIALALVLWGVLERDEAAVRTHISPARIVGLAALGRWVTLGRWADAAIAGRLFPKLGPVARARTRRGTAARTATALMGLAPPGDRARGPEVAAWLGGAHAA